MNDLDKPIELYELISKVRTDLEAARTEGEGRGIRFKVESVELELQMTAKRVTKGEGGIELYVFKAGANHEREQGDVQTIKVRMVPELAKPDASGNTPVLIDQKVEAGKLPR